MSKTIVIKLTKIGDRLSTFDISDNFGNVLGTDVPKEKLIDGIAVSIDNAVTVIIITPTGKNCCNVKSLSVPVTTITDKELISINTVNTNTSSIWRHLTDPQIYNTYYGCTEPYIIEYPFTYQYHDEILQNVKDYTKAYKYLPTDDGVFNYNRKISVDNEWFNKAILYNDYQSSGVLELVPKPMHNLKEYLKYPIYNTDSKTITYTKSDSFYQYNTFWSLVKEKTVPLFVKSCESLSIDKEINQPNMDYGKRSFKKEPLRSKDLRVRHILDNKSDIHLTSQFIYAPAQISYK